MDVVTAPTTSEHPAQFPLWTTFDVATRLRQVTLGRKARFVDVILEKLDACADQLDEIVRADQDVVASPLFGTRAVVAEDVPARTQVTIQGLLPSQRRVIEQLAAERGLRPSQLITRVLDHALPPAH